MFTGEDLYVHYSTIEDFNWGIMLCRYETQVFAGTHEISRHLLRSFAAMVFVIVLYLLLVMKNERRRTTVTAKASSIRKLLLDVNQQNDNIFESLKNIQEFSSSRSVFFVDTDEEEYNYVLPKFKELLLSGDERKYLIKSIFKYSAEYHNINKQTISYMSIRTDAHLMKTNKELYDFLIGHNINEIAFASITDKNNHVSILGVTNPERRYLTRVLLEDIAVCFSIAIYNKKHLHKTEAAATTDSLTGALNRVSFKKDILVFDREKPEDFTCIYIDVNELHIRNNKYGHAAGDEMLIYIANSLKDVFYGNNVYRMGGDEFLVFIKDTDTNQIRLWIDQFMEMLKPKGYNVAIGMSYRKQNTNCEEMVREAEVRMYEAKAEYYQNKEQTSVTKNTDKNFVHTKTGILEIDTIISILKDHYNGIYRVSLKDDSARRILMPSYLGYHEEENNFSKLFAKYVDESVHPDFHRAVMSFLNYDAIKRQISENKTPKITFKKVNGETVILSVYQLGDNKEDVQDTLWVFARD
jgi:diguanylate cyclase (GGDEF)-like protein